jgi:hypothetical protein
VGYLHLGVFSASFTGLNLAMSTVYNAGLSVGTAGDSGLFYVYGGATGGHYTVIFDYLFTKIPANWTGIQWSSGTSPVLSGDTGVRDMIHLMYDGARYYAQASLGYK